MAVYRVARTGNFTVMANYHLRDKNLTLKAKGLLSLILSLPEKWNFSIKGLARICKEGVDAIRAAIQELMSAGYIICSRVRNALGQLKGTEYVIYERPQSVQQEAQEEKSEGIVSEPDGEAPVFSSPVLAEPTQDEPILENPTLEKTAQINNNKLSTTGNNNPVSVTPKNNINKKPIEKNPNPSNPYPSSRQGQAAWVLAEPERRKDRVTFPVNGFSSSWHDGPTSSDLTQQVKEQICFSACATDHGYEIMSEIVDLIVSVLIAPRDFYVFDGARYPGEFVKAQFNKLTHAHIDNVFSNLNQTHTKIHRLDSYLTKCLLTATLTMNNQLEANARESLYQKEKREEMWENEEKMMDLVTEMDDSFWQEVKKYEKKRYGIRC